MNTDQLSSLVRTVMKLAAALLASHGLADTAGLINTPDVTAAALLIVSLLWSHFSHADPDGTPPTTGTGTRLALWLALIIPALVFTGCAALAPGARPEVVRAEQSISIGSATLNTAIHMDNANRAFYQTNLPPFHAFCEWLRQPVTLAPLTNAYPRGLAIVRSADAVKNRYKASGATNDLTALTAALATLETALSQAQGYLAQIPQPAH